MIHPRSIFIFFLCILFFCCAPKVDLETEKQAILAMHNAQKEQHFNKDAIAFVDQFSDNYISVNNGKISTPQRTKSKKV